MTEICSTCGDTRERYDHYGCYAPVCPMDPVTASPPPVQPAPVPAAPSTHEPPRTALDGDMAAVDEACERLSATCDGITRTRPSTHRFTEHPETISGDPTPAFIEFAMCIHPGQPYDSAETVWLCRQAYDLGKEEGSAEINRLNATIQGQRDVADELREALGAIWVRFHERGAEIERLRNVATLTERLLDAIDADGEWLTMLHPIRAALRRETP
jgi:hypothetical protein